MIKLQTSLMLSFTFEIFYETSSQIINVWTKNLTKIVTWIFSSWAMSSFNPCTWVEAYWNQGYLKLGMCGANSFTVNDITMKYDVYHLNPLLDYLRDCKYAIFSISSYWTLWQILERPIIEIPLDFSNHYLSQSVNFRGQD